jgi:hypothetical protein
MGVNVYLENKRSEYDTLRKSIEAMQQRAAEAKRDLTNEELRSVIEMGEKAKGLYQQIQDLSEIELRNAKVQEMAERVTSAVTAAAGGSGQQSPGSTHVEGVGDLPGLPGADGQFRSVGGAQTQDRDPGFYTRGSQFSFLGDQYRAANLGDDSAKERLAKHANALRDNQHLRDVLGAGATTGGSGLVPPVWLAEAFAPVLHRRLRVASVLRQIPWAGPFPWTIPVASTAALTGAVAEGVNTTETDPYYVTVTVTPTTIMGYSEVSRQMLEASNPAVDAIIWGDLLGDFYDRCELTVIAALEAQANVNLATVTDNTSATNMRNNLLDGIAAVCLRNSKWVGYLKLTDTTNRPLIVAQRYNPMNATGEGDLMSAFRSPIQGSLESLAVVTSPTIGTMRGFVLNSQEILYQNSPPMQFTFEQPAGPALVRIGVWGYMAVSTARRPKAITKITYSNN